VAASPVLRPLYPDDLDPARERLAGFLIQYWGGPDTYSQERGHPRLRMRHAPFRITSVERNAWFACMRASVEASGAAVEVRDALLEYFDRAADAMVNTAG
jgi:hemoglobin